MKQFQIILLILSLSAANLHSQTSVYHPFADSATWRGELYTSTCGGFCFCVTEQMKDDTVIGSFTYKKLSIGALRQEVAMKRVYFYSYNDYQEYLLYDFNLAVGDTISPFEWWGTVGSMENLVVTSVDSVLVGGSYRKAFTLTGSISPPITIVEGIGNYNSLPTSPIGGDPLWGEMILKCYQENGHLLASWLGYCNCSDLVFLEKYSLDQLVFFLPNPATNLIRIQVPAALGMAVKIETYDHLGRLKLSLDYASEVNVSTLPTGLYFLVMTNDKGERLTGRFVKE